MISFGIIPHRTIAPQFGQYRLSRSSRPVNRYKVAPIVSADNKEGRTVLTLNDVAGNLNLLCQDSKGGFTKDAMMSVPVSILPKQLLHLADVAEISEALTQFCSGVVFCSYLFDKHGLSDGFVIEGHDTSAAEEFRFKQRDASLMMENDFCGNGKKGFFLRAVDYSEDQPMFLSDLEFFAPLTYLLGYVRGLSLISNPSNALKQYLAYRFEGKAIKTLLESDKLSLDHREAIDQVWKPCSKEGLRAVARELSPLDRNSIKAIFRKDA